jgi:mono/diheme cytochrome c family protein
MKQILSGIAIALLLFGCGEKKETQKEGFEMNRTKKEEATTQQASQGVPVDLNNKGIGPITSVSFDDEIDMELAKAGETKYQMICTACHMIGQRMIGPDLTGIYSRRSPEWVMNMILNPDVMIKEDPIAKALLKEYNGAIMLNQNLSEAETRALAEYLRTL